MIQFTVLGQPTPQGSKTAIVRGGKAVVVEGGDDKARQRFADWREAVRAEAQRCMVASSEAVIDGPVSVVITFWLPRPSSLPKWRTLPWRKPDLDKLVRCVLDGITGIVVVDDARVVSILAAKRYAAGGQPTGCAVTVRPIDERSRVPWA